MPLQNVIFSSFHIGNCFKILHHHVNVILTQSSLSPSLLNIDAHLKKKEGEGLENRCKNNQQMLFLDARKTDNLNNF